MAGLALVAVPGGTVEPVIRFTPEHALKFAAAIVLFGAGMHYLTTGRKEADLGRMITGAILALVSLLFL
ncbi:MAG: hypothetical protein KGJ84_03625 [Elusimicrobia bacterium]|nr:hypothetical protein [Elusimicrobiota bacterium]